MRQAHHFHSLRTEVLRDRAAVSVGVALLWAAASSFGCGVEPPESKPSEEARPRSEPTPEPEPIYHADFVLRAPEPPGSPVLTPCPQGWESVPVPVPDPGVEVCIPASEGSEEDCPFGTARFLGDDRCQPVGRACPEGAWPEDLPGDVLYVDDDAPDGGRGRAPGEAFASIAEALAVAPSGATVAVAKGFYDEVLTLPDGVRLRGACAAATILRPSWSHERAREAGVIRLAPGATAALEDIGVVDAPHRGVVVEGEGSRLRANGLALALTELVGVEVRGGAELDAEEVSVTYIRNDLARSIEGVGMVVHEASRARVDRAVLSNADRGGVIVSGLDAQLALSDVLIRDISAAAITVRDDARVELEEALLERNFTGISGFGSETRLELRDLLIRDSSSTLGNAPYRHGPGLRLSQGARAEVSRATFDRTRGAALMVASDAEASMEDVVITRTRPTADGQGGFGLFVSSGGRVELDRAHLDFNADVGILAAFSDTEASLRDVVVRRTRPRSDDTHGRGLGAVRGARIELDPGRVERSHEAAVFVDFEGSSARLAHLAIEQSMPRTGGLLGAGLVTRFGGRVELHRVAIEGTSEVAVFVHQSEIDLDEVAIRDVLGAPCRARGHCSPSVYWDAIAGLAVTNRSTVTARRLRIERVDRCGLIAGLVDDDHDGEADIGADAITLQLDEASIDHTEVGMCVQVEGLDGGARLALDPSTNLTPIMTTELVLPHPEAWRYELP